MYSLNDGGGGSLADIEGAAKKYAVERDALSVIVREAEARIAAVKELYVRSIKNAVKKTAQRENELRELVDQSRELFVKPRTVIFHGVRIGLLKGKGKIEFADEAKVIELIRKKLPECEASLVRVTESVVKKALANLPVADLRLIGCTLVESGDQVMVESTDGDIEKMVDALLRGMIEEGVDQ